VQAAYHSLLRRGADLGGAPVIGWLVTAVVRIAYRRKATQSRQRELARRLDSPRPEKGPERTAWERDRDVRIRAEVHRYSRGAAIGSLRLADPPRVRDYLLRRLEKERDPGLFYQTALTLGALEEPAGARYVDDRIRGPGWSGVRRYVFIGLAGMGGEEARRVLEEIVRDPRLTKPTRYGGYRDVASALRALARLDPAGARREAERIRECSADEDLHRTVQPFLGR